MLFVDLGNLQQINFLQNDRDVVPIMQPVNTTPRNVTEDEYVTPQKNLCLTLTY